MENAIAQLTTSLNATNAQIAETNATVKELTQSTNAQIAKTNATVAQLAELMTKIANPTSGSSNNNNNNSNGGGTNSAPSSPVTISGNVIKSKNGVKTTILETAPTTTSTKEEEPLTKLGKNASMQSRIDALGFNPFLPPEDYEDDDEDTIVQTVPGELKQGPPNIKYFSFIEKALPPLGAVDFEKAFCTADLEAIITPEGLNYTYMAAWYNNLTNKIHHISPSNPTLEAQELFLKGFWKDLIENNKGRTCYFHNWGGYDAILSLPSLLNCLPGLSFKPIIKDGEILSLEVFFSQKS